MEYKTFRAGFTNNGIPSNINVVRSLEKSLARRIALQSGKKRRVHELEEELEQLSKYPAQNLERITKFKKKSKH